MCTARHHWFPLLCNLEQKACLLSFGSKLLKAAKYTLKMAKLVARWLFEVAWIVWKVAKSCNKIAKLETLCTSDEIIIDASDCQDCNAKLQKNVVVYFCEQKKMNNLSVAARH